MLDHRQQLGRDEYLNKAVIQIKERFEESVPEKNLTKPQVRGLIQWKLHTRYKCLKGSKKMSSSELRKIFARERGDVLNTTVEPAEGFQTNGKKSNPSPESIHADSMQRSGIKNEAIATFLTTPAQTPLDQVDKMALLNREEIGCTDLDHGKANGVVMTPSSFLDERAIGSRFESLADNIQNNALALSEQYQPRQSTADIISVIDGVLGFVNELTSWSKLAPNNFLTGLLGSLVFQHAFGSECETNAPCANDLGEGDLSKIGEPEIVPCCKCQFNIEQQLAEESLPKPFRGKWLVSERRR